MEKFQHYINGKWTDGSSKETINVVNPANGKDIGQVVCAQTDDVNAAVEAALNSYKSRVLVDMLPMERAKLMRSIANELRAVSKEGGVKI